MNSQRIASATELPEKGGAEAECSESRLVQAAKRDRKALATLYQRNFPAIDRYVRCRVRDTHEAEDIISEVFVTMVRKLPAYRVRGIPFRIWLYRIANIQLRRAARSRARRALAEFREGDVGNVPEYGQGADLEMLHLVVATLPDRLQSVIALHYLEGLKISDIAKVTSRSVGTIKARLHKARGLMRDRLKQRGFKSEY